MKKRERTRIYKIAGRALTVFLCIALAVSLSGCSLLQGTLLLMNMRGQDETKAGEPGSGKSEIEILTDTDMDFGLVEDGMEYYTEQIAWESAAANGYVALPEYPLRNIDWNTEEYKYMDENGWMSVLTSPFSTFAADVDTASYANLRRMILAGQEVPASAVRIEEMINYFTYDYPAPEGKEPFSVTAKITPCPWNDQARLMLIGLQARQIEQEERAASNLVFLIDVSGSMDEYNKLPLVQRAFRLLINELDGNDTVSIVTYANEDRIVLDGTSGDEKTTICDTVEDLSPNGGTNGSAGLIRAYELAEKHFIKGGNNRVILATDGDLNIGMTDEGSLTRLIEEKASSDVYLSVLGFGQGNISDTNMEALADHGNGNYSYIDTINEARRVLIDEAGGTLFTVAKDVKLQVEFNPDKVKGYRLIGYENRTMAAEEFADDGKDGGEIGSGHTVTALYEILPSGSKQEIPTAESRYGKTETEARDPYADEWGIVHVRYKDPDAGTDDAAVQMDVIVDDDCVQDEMDDTVSWAAGVAQAGMILKDSGYAGDTDLKEVRERMKALTGNDEFREEFVYLLTRIE